MSELIQLAKKTAQKAHKDQVDKAGNDYYQTHIMTVYNSLKEAGLPEKYLLVGLLHDTIEDSNYTLDDLEKLGFPLDVISAIYAITKKSDEPYETYLINLKKNELARVVKLADIKHNMDLNRLKVITDKDIKRHEKYKKAYQFLSE